MAKVAGPLGSFEASGRIGQYCVHFNWKGINVVRKWTKPTNPQTILQADVRTFTGGIGRATKPVVLQSLYQKRVLASTPTGMTWVSYIVKTLANVFNMAIDNIETEYADVPEAAKTEFSTQAENLGLIDFTAPGGQNTFKKEYMLYALYRFGRQMYENHVEGWDREPYNVNRAQLTASHVQQLVSDITTL
jgi:hypothetical protein